MAIELITEHIRSKLRQPDLRYEAQWLHVPMLEVFFLRHARGFILELFSLP